MKINRKKHTPDRVEQLSNCEIFVFGSNLEGQHMGEKEKIAFDLKWIYPPKSLNRQR